MPINFGIVTPTYNRPTLLRRFLRRVGRQTYSQWRLLVVHDGPNPSIKSSVEHFGRTDPRITYVETEVSAADSGVTPRAKGVERFIGGDQTPDYLVFWDDDNAYMLDALEQVAVALEKAERPDLLIVNVKYGWQIIPPAGAPIRSLQVGQVDTASLVFRPSLALDAYTSVMRRTKVAPKETLLFNDFLAYDYVNRLLPPRSIKHDAGVIVCQHDGLRWGPYIRLALRVPPLGLARLVGFGR
jgi:glycosyltransferase involved in cell wall biosynthesis